MTLHAQGNVIVLYLTDNRHLEAQLCRNHDHGAYIRGWCDYLEFDGGSRFAPNNTYSFHYAPGKYKSYQDGMMDAFHYITNNK